MRTSKKFKGLLQTPAGAGFPQHIEGNAFANCYQYRLEEFPDFPNDLVEADRNAQAFR